MDSTLLPPNASPLERAVEGAMQFSMGVETGIADVLTFRENPPDSALLFLVWEYGLEDLLPYVPDLRSLLVRGVPWQRIRGTPRAICTALEWLGGVAPTIEEDSTGGPHWFEYMIDPGAILDADGVRAAAALASLSSPVGTRLSRLYHGYDVRRFVLDQSDWGDLLSTDSGVMDQTSGLVLSFGRKLTCALVADAPQSNLSVTRTRSITDVYDDRILLDYGCFGDTGVPNHTFEHGLLFQLASGPELAQPQAGAHVHLLPMAAVVLSDGPVLDDTDATLFATALQEEGAPDPLSDGLALSGVPWHLDVIPVDARHERAGQMIGRYDTPTLRGSIMIWYGVRTTGEPTTTEPTGARISRMQGLATRVSGQYWTNLPWGQQTWLSPTYNVRTSHHGDPA